MDNTGNELYNTGSELYNTGNELYNGEVTMLRKIESRAVFIFSQ